MIYPNKNGVALMGSQGFIGQALSKKKLPKGVYFFDSPSSNVLFDEHLDYCMEETINSFLKVLQYCRDTKTYLVYPSSATVLNKNTSYARCKAVLEELHLAYGIPALGLRIAAGYGPGEAHKGQYASVVYQWCKMMKLGERPTIYGDGTQTRDFIFEDDIADIIEKLARNETTGIVEVGTGINTSFNEVVHTINHILGTYIEPIYVKKPSHYVQETVIYPREDITYKYSLEEGIIKILKSL